MCPALLELNASLQNDLDNEIGDDPAVLSVHPGPVGVEDPGDPDLNPGPLVVGVGQGLRHPLALVVAGAGPDGVDIAPVRLGLRVHLRVPVHLRQLCKMINDDTLTQPRSLTL